MPQLAFNASVVASIIGEASFSASVDPVLDREFTGSMVASIQPERDLRGSVALVPAGGVYIGFNASVFAFFTPITPDRQIFGSVRAVSVAAVSRDFTGSIVRVASGAYNQVFTASVFKSLIGNKTFTATTVARTIDSSLNFTASVKYTAPVVRSFNASAVLRATIEKLFTGSVRPASVLSGGELTIYTDAVNYLIPVVLERDANEVQIAALTERNNFLNDDIARVLAILNDIDNKPSVLLDVVSPNANLRRLGGETLVLSGNFYIPTCLVRLKQGVSDFGTFETVETSMSQVTVVTPDFTALGGIVLTSPIEISVENPNGEVSESLLITLATT